MRIRRNRDSVTGLLRPGLPIIFISLAIISVFLSFLLRDAGMFQGTVRSLEKKEETVIAFAGTSAAASVAIALVPDDSTTPIADKIADMSGYLVAISVVLLLEKCLVGVAPYLFFTWLLPCVCVLAVIYCYSRRKIWLEIAVKLLIFALCMLFLVPFSVSIADRIDRALNTEEIVQNVMTNEQALAEESESEDDSRGLLDRIGDFFTGIFNSVGEVLEGGKKLLGQFIDAIAAMILTTCVIPLLVFGFLIWLGKTLFGSLLERYIRDKDEDKAGRKGRKNGMKALDSET